MADILVYRCRRCEREWQAIEVEDGTASALVAARPVPVPTPRAAVPDPILVHLCGPNRVGLSDLVGADLNIDAESDCNPRPPR